MPQEPTQPFDETNLESPEYRERLMRKLNCLIAVLEVANAKVNKSLSGPAPDVDRLTRIRTNLTSTLEVCRRARRALERRESLPEGLPENLAQAVRASEIQPKRRRAMSLPRGANVEMSSPAEHRRFVDLGRITPREITACDMDELAQMLQG